MRSWSIPIGRLFGIEIRIHLTFFFLLVFVWSTETAAQDAGAGLRVLGLVGIIFGSVVLHELGHALVARGSGVPAKGIILLPIGGITILDEANVIPDPINGADNPNASRHHSGDSHAFSVQSTCAAKAS